MAVLNPIREKYHTLLSRPDDLSNLLEENAKKCTARAKQTILEVKEKMGLKAVWKI